MSETDIEIEILEGGYKLITWVPCEINGEEGFKERKQCAFDMPSLLTLVQRSVEELQGIEQASIEKALKEKAKGKRKKGDEPPQKESPPV